MICFKGRTYCQFYTDCKDGYSCWRSFTPDVQEAANDWWNSFCGEDQRDQAPVCLFTSKPYCFKAVEN